MKKRAIFFDRDGVVNYRIVGAYVKTKHEFNFIPDFIPFFSMIKNLGYLAIIITNQQGIGKGLMDLAELEVVHTAMQTELLSLTNNSFDDIFFCSDLAETNSLRRKPNPGMLFDAIEKWDIEIENSWLIGDSKSDIEAGIKAKVKTILLQPDYCRFDFGQDMTVASLNEISHL
jgi:D-glycero-D-manno-heptose 1,7-bisphosphate phosphatase